MIGAMMTGAKENNMTDILKETNDYKLVVGTTAHHSDTPAMQMYQVINTVTGVIELETSVLPRAMNMIDSVQRDLDNVREGRNMFFDPDSDPAFERVLEPVPDNTSH